MLPQTIDETLARALVEAGPDALIVSDGEGRIVLANARAEQLFGYAPSELAGSPLEVLIPERLRAEHVSLRRAFAARPEPRSISVERAGSEVAVAVTNQGEGIPPDSIRQLFQRFHRAADGKLASVKGVGLGLYIARELIEAHGGHLGAESTPEGATTFRFTLPGR